MIVCICNRLKDTRVEAAITAGAATPADVFKRCSVRRNCANCQDKIKAMIRAAKDRVRTQAAE